MVRRRQKPLWLDSKSRAENRRLRDQNLRDLADLKHRKVRMQFTTTRKETGGILEERSTDR